MRPMKVVKDVAHAQQEHSSSSQLKLTDNAADEHFVSPVGKPNHLLDDENAPLQWANADSKSPEQIHESSGDVGDMILDTRPLNLFNETFDHDCLRLLPAEEAWKSLVLPIRIHDGSLICATTKSMLDDALSLLEKHVKDTPVKLTFVESHLLEMFIAERYGYEGVEADE
ncbi:hypothetical protein JD969_01390 [Planctomycetota bacterium]|nr:hypothetical protein JD969_01390 [Planctomycetota bacterium]